MTTFKKVQGLLTEKRMASKYDADYKRIIDSFRKGFKWSAKPAKTVASASHEITGPIFSTTKDYKNVVTITIAWHQPHTKWGSHWAITNYYVSVGPDSRKKLGITNSIDSFEVEGWQDLIDTPQDEKLQKKNMDSAYKGLKWAQGEAMKIMKKL